MKGFLSYRPQYEYKRDLRAMLESYVSNEIPESGVSEVEPDIGRVGSFNTYIASVDYEPSQSVEEAIEITPTDVIDLLITAETKLNKLTEHLVNQPETPGIPTTNEYIEAVERGDKDTAYEYEDHYENAYEENTSKELIPFIKYQKDQIEFVKNIIKDRFEIERIKSGESLEEEQDKEKKKLEGLIEKERDNQMGLKDYAKLTQDNHLIYFLHNRAESSDGAADELGDIVYDKLSGKQEMFERIANLLNKAPGLKDPLSITNRIQFDKHRKNAEDAKFRMRRIINIEYKEKLYEEMKRVEEAKGIIIDGIPLLHSESGLASEEDEINIFITDQTEAMDEVVNTSDNIVKDLYKITELEELQEIDYITSVAKKTEHRIIHTLLTEQ